MHKVASYENYKRTMANIRNSLFYGKAVAITAAALETDPEIDPRPSLRLRIEVIPTRR